VAIVGFLCISQIAVVCCIGQGTQQPDIKFQYFGTLVLHAQHGIYAYYLHNCVCVVCFLDKMICTDSFK